MSPYRHAPYRETLPCPECTGTGWRERSRIGPCKPLACPCPVGRAMVDRLIAEMLAELEKDVAELGKAAFG